ncbi:protein of unknown function [Ectopseudomonas oleovorans]|nr:protein of unknown function [Pseudomonas oleovorans]
MTMAVRKQETRRTTLRQPARRFQPRRDIKGQRHAWRVSRFETLAPKQGCRVDPLRHAPPAADEVDFARQHLALAVKLRR